MRAARLGDVAVDTVMAAVKHTFGGAALLVPALLLPSTAEAQTPLVSTDELAPFDADFVRYPALTAQEREYYLQRWKAMLEEARAQRAEGTASPLAAVGRECLFRLFKISGRRSKPGRKAAQVSARRDFGRVSEPEQHTVF